ncbi:MAG: hypothetical protein Q9191_003333 [Dirinaria sp. TL-2023a]
MLDSSSAAAPGRGSWLRVAALMGSKPEMAIFRKFRVLNALRLLEMQSDLMQQEQDYAYICSRDARVDCPATRSYPKDWEALNESLGKGGPHQRDAWRKLRNGLDSYTLVQQIKICKQDGPSKHDLNILQDWLVSAEGNESSLRGPGWDAWEKEQRGLWDIGNDYVDDEFGLTDYNDAKISVAADITCTLFAPLLTTVPMFVLYFVSDIRTRLGIIMGFTTLFSISLALFSSARRIEVFAATSAFAAVQAVYVTVNQ